MSVVTRPFSGFYRNFSNDRPGNTNLVRPSNSNLVRLSDTDRVLDEPIQVAACDRLPDNNDSFTLGAEPQGALVEAPRFDAGVEAESASEETWAALEVEKSLGQLMTEVRNYRGLSREEVAAQTKIPAYYIRMIESDCYDAVPDQLYLLPFFERYAIFLGIDAQQVLSRFLRDFEKAENEIAAPPPCPPLTNVVHRSRRIAEAAAIVGILLLLVFWEIGAMRAAHHRKPDDSSNLVVSSVARPSTAIATSDGRPRIAAAQVPAPQVPAPPPSTAANTTESSAIPQIAPPPHAQTKQRRHSHVHQLSHHSRHSRRGTS